MPNGDLSIQRNINHWSRALCLMGARPPEAKALVTASLHLTEALLDGPQFGPGQTEWFQLDAQRMEVFLDDGVSTVRLANRRVVRDLYGERESALVSWFGYRSEDYELHRHAGPGGPEPKAEDSSRMTWVAWDLGAWRTYLFNGSRFIPITRSSPMTSKQPAGAHRATWAGWDFQNMDIFTSDPPEPGAKAVLVGSDDSLIVVHDPHRP